MKRVYSIIFLLLTVALRASHIVGGEVIYDCLGTDATGRQLYRITLKIYRDCTSGNTAFDGTPNFNTPAIITIREAEGLTLQGTYDVGAPVITRVPPTINNPCVTTPVDICVEEGIYTTTVSLLPKAGGYYVIYQRCCRNITIDNLFAPSATGSTYYTHIPGPELADCNNSPRFRIFPPLFLCANIDFKFDHSATDPDGDQLEYSFYKPFTGGELCCPAIGNFAPTSPGCPSICPTAAAGPPYENVSYVAPYEYNYPVPSGPSLTINSAGLLTGRPSLIGQYVVGICVKEYRNGRLLTTHFRDFQFNIRGCNAQVTSGMVLQKNKCEGLSITFTNTSISTSGTPTARWDFGVATASNDTSLLINPTFNYPDTGTYEVTLISDRYKTCTDTIRRTVFVYPKLDVLFPPAGPQCLNANSFVFVAQGQYSTGTSFFWDFTAAANPSVVSGQSAGPVSFSSGGLFPVTLSARFGPCEDRYSDQVQVISQPPELSQNRDTTIVIGQTVVLDMNHGAQYNYNWTPLTDYLNCSPCTQPAPAANPPSSIVYTLVTTEPNGCFETVRSYSVFVDFKASLDVPSAFSPNGDGVNDLIFPDGWGLKQLNYFRIYNRWGQLLFETNDLKTGWDGRFNGIPQNMDNYVYQAEAETLIAEPKVLRKTGSFRLIR